MEKDAVETLVFMSSPKNASYQRGSLLGTPLRREVAGREREVGGRGRGEREVERVLDGSGGESSSSGEEEEEEEEGGRMRMRRRMRG
jgi:hypothetical protein